MKQTLSALLALLTLCCLLALTACAASPPGEAPTGEPWETPPDRSYAPVTVYLGEDFSDDVFSFEESAAQNAQQAAQAAGFPVYFTLSKPQRWDDHLYSLDKLLQEGGMAILSPDEIKGLRGRGVELGNIQSAAYDIIPKYMERLLFLGEDEACLPLTPHGMDELARPAVLVREDLYALYGEEIKTWADYLAFLELAREKAPDAIPGVIPTDDAYGGAGYGAYFSPAISAMLGQEGYWQVNAYFSAMLFADDNAQVYPFEALDAFHAGMRELEELRERGYVRMTSRDNTVSFGDKIASLVIPAGEYAMLGARYTEGTLSSAGSLPTSYRMCVLYPDTMPDMRTGIGAGMERMLVMGEGCDPAAFLAFLVAIHTDAALYRQVMVGEEGQNYTLDEDGKLVFSVGYNTAEREPWVNQSQNLLVFHDYEMNAKLNLAKTPLNYYEAIGAIKTTGPLGARLGETLRGQEDLAMQAFRDRSEEVSRAISRWGNAMGGYQPNEFKFDRNAELEQLLEILSAA